MSVMQSVPRSLLSQSRLATITIKRMMDNKARQRMETRRRRLEAKKGEDAPEECYKSLIRSENRCNQPRLKILFDECLDDPCGLAPLPMDLDHYTPSDKQARRYQRTWCECYALPMKYVSPKKCYPDRPRRKLRRASRPYECVMALNTKGSGRIKPEKLIDVECTKKGQMTCCKIPAPGCARGRADPSCQQYFPPSCCKKRRTKYPSFSECRTEGLLGPIPPCECEMKANLCDVWAHWRRFHGK